MLRALKTLFAHPGADAGAERRARELAGAALLVEIARVHDGTSAAERAAIVTALRSVFELREHELQALVAASEQVVEDAASLHEFTSVINTHFTHAQKVSLIESLWQVAYADRHIDRYEEHYIRRIADLLHVAHKDFIRAKHRAVPDPSPPR